jgi:arylsulfatase A-like enzyme
LTSPFPGCAAFALRGLHNFDGGFKAYSALANLQTLYYIDPMRKKVFWTLAALFFVVVLFLIYLFLNYRKAGQWTQWKPGKNQVNITKKRPKKNHLHQILFLNEIYQNYDSFLPISYKSLQKKQAFEMTPPKERHLADREWVGGATPLNKFSADLSGISVIKGEKTRKKRNLLISGEEILLAVWKPGKLMETNYLDLMEIELLYNRNIKIAAFVVPKPGGILDKLKSSIDENIFAGTPPGNLLYQTSLKINKKRQFKTIAIDLPQQLGDGILIKMNPLGENKRIRVKIRNVHLLSRKFKIIENMPQSGYFKYGGFERRMLKSVFLRPGSTLTYLIETDPDQRGSVFLEGYLGSVDEKPITFKILVNEKPVVFEEVSKGVSYFKSEVESRQNKFKLAIHVSGDSSGRAALGNLGIYRDFQKKQNVVVYLVDAVRADKGGIKEKVFESSFKNGAIFENAYANATRTADSLPALFTGKYKFTLVAKKHDIPHVQENEFLLAEYFKGKGYTTAAFINNPWLHLSNSSQGFDFVNLCWTHVEKAFPFPSQDDYTNLKYGEMEKYLQEFVQQNKNKPVFVYIHTMEPHVPYEPPKKMRRYSANADPGVLTTLFNKVTQSPSYPDLTNPGEEQLNVLKSLYKDQVLIAYDFFKRVHDYLEAESIINPQSLLILTSDHGERFYRHGSWIHGPPDVYNEVLRIPLMMKGPRIKPGTYAQNVQLVDIYPTIMDWFGDKPRKNLVGNSLLDYMNRIKREEVFTDRVIYIDGTGNRHHYGYAYIKDKIKVIIAGDKVEVYHLGNDSGETVNMEKDPLFKQLIAEARAFGQKFKNNTDKKRKKLKMSEQEKQRLKTLGYLE